MTTVIGQQHSTRGGTAQAPMSDETCAAIYSIVQDLRAQADALFASLPVNAQPPLFADTPEPERGQEGMTYE